MGAVTDALARVVVLLIEGLFVHLAASVAIESPRFVKALVVVVLANIVGFLVFSLFPRFPTFSFLLVLVAWLTICGSVYKTTWVRAFVIGLLGYLLWALTKYVLELVETVPLPF